ncbi:very short patch repair endonuclease [Mesorhizobium sp. ESP6-5]|uniref:very short patch repair endonuclease n=1 Tax=Mesorhizobium sp. ESP6-5 TaxID=2876623 RepID=UPI001CCE6CC4|nr:very short patch repair endonuclease [Mesorhizobium sp. ESP6-5]MBZ9753677.1 very short patch repair endonuclease [Mesorhizobium sp. ESP6-5]
MDRVTPVSPSAAMFAEVPETRRRIMRAIRSTDTRPERTLRAKLHALGYRFRKNVAGLPGKPDVAFSRKRKAIFVHGCFWHSHARCKNALRPRTRSDYWKQKLDNTIERDRRNLAKLQEIGWQTFVVWECQLAADGELQRQLTGFLGNPREEE